MGSQAESNGDVIFSLNFEAVGINESFRVVVTGPKQRKYGFTLGNGMTRNFGVFESNFPALNNGSVISQ